MNRLEKLVVNSPFRAFYLSYVSLPYLLRQVKLPVNPSCLEIGCGTGHGSATLHRRLKCRYFLAIDYDPMQISIARDRFSHLVGLNYILGSADTLPVKNDYFDAVFDMGILHHIEQWGMAVEEIYRALKPGGVFIFEDIFRPLVDSFLFTPFDHPEGGKFSDQEFINTLEETGFTLTKRFQIARHYIIGVARKKEG